jgi:hypothetical protein
MNKKIGILILCSTDNANYSACCRILGTTKYSQVAQKIGVNLRRPFSGSFIPKGENYIDLMKKYISISRDIYQLQSCLSSTFLRSATMCTHNSGVDPCQLVQVHFVSGCYS